MVPIEVIIDRYRLEELKLVSDIINNVIAGTNKRTGKADEKTKRLLEIRDAIAEEIADGIIYS